MFLGSDLNIEFIAPCPLSYLIFISIFKSDPMSYDPMSYYNLLLSERLTETIIYFNVWSNRRQMNIRLTINCLKVIFSV